MSAGLNRGRIPDGEYTTYEMPPSYAFVDDLLHECFDVGDNPNARVYWEVLLTINYGPHYCSEPRFSLNLTKVSREPETGYDAHGSFKTNRILSKSTGVPAIRSLAHMGVDEMTYLPEAARASIKNRIDAFTPDPNKLPGDCRARPQGAVGDAESWDDNPFVEFPDGMLDVRLRETDPNAPRLRMWDSDSPGITIHTTAHGLGLDSDDCTGVYVQGAGTEFTPVERVVIDGEEWERPNSAGFCTHYERDGVVDRIEGDTAYVSTS